MVSEKQDAAVEADKAGSLGALAITLIALVVGAVVVLDVSSRYMKYQARGRPRKRRRKPMRVARNQERETQL